MAVSTQLAVPRLALWQRPTATEARYRRGGIGSKVLKSVVFRDGDGFPRAKGSRELPSAAKQLKLAEYSTADTDADAEPKKPQRGFVETWFSGGYVAWPEVHRLLTERSVKNVELQEAYDLAQSGAAILVDVRESQDFKKIHAQGAFGAPIFQLIQGNDLKANIRRLGYALLTDFAGTERNPNFIYQALQAVGGDKKRPVIVICDIGGTLSTFVERKGPKAKKYADPQRRFGRASRSLRAVFELQEVGFENVSYLIGGLGSWIHQDLPTEGGEK